MLTQVKASKTTFRLFLLLIGTCAFSLSSLPGSSHGESALSSLGAGGSSGCDYADSLHNSANGADCSFKQTVDDMEVRSRVTVRATPEHQMDYLTVDNVPKDLGIKNVIHVNIESETDCLDCELGHRSKTDSFSVQISDLGNISSIIEQHMKAKNQELAAEQVAHDKKVEAAKKKKEDIENCVIDAKGKSIARSARLGCYVTQMGKLKDDDDAADYYEKNVAGEVRSMLASDDPAKIQKGMALLEKLNQAHVGGDFVKESIAEMSMLGGAKIQASKLHAQLLNPNLTAAQKVAIANQASYLEGVANTWFGVQKQSVNDNPFLNSNLSFDPNQALLTRMAADQQSIDMTYDQIVAAQRAAITPQVVPRGTPAIPNAPQTNTPGATNIQNMRLGAPVTYGR